METQYTQSDVKLLEEKVLAKHFFTLSEIRLKFKRFDGSFSREVCRELLKQGESIGVLPYDPVLKKILLVEQFRVGAMSDEASPWLYEIVAGRNDKQQTCEEIAESELEEEAGLKASALTKMCEYWVSPGATNEKFILYLAHCDLSNAGGVHGLLEEDEDIRSHLLSVSTIKTMIDNGQIRNSMTLIALQWFLLNVEL